MKPHPTPTPAPAAGSERYVFSDQRSGGHRHAELVAHLAAILDPFPIYRLTPHVQKGARCLEVGAGAGTIAIWPAQQVGDGGEVVATDTDPSRIPGLQRMTALAHNIVTDSIPGTFDLTHARLVLAHLPQRYAVLDKLAATLNSGGVVAVEEFAAGGWRDCVLDAADEDAARLFEAYHEALVTVMERDGTTDTGRGRDVHRAMRRAGLVYVESELWARTWHGGQRGCLLPYTAAAQLRGRLVAAGMDDDDLNKFRAMLLDPNPIVHNSLAVSTVGRRAGGGW